MKFQYSLFLIKARLVNKLCLVIALSFIPLTSISAFETTTNFDKIKQLDTRFKKLSQHVYLGLAQKTSNTHSFQSNIDKLYKQVNQQLKTNNDITAVTLIHKNINLINNNINNRTIPDFIEILLNHNNYIMAKNIFLNLQSNSRDFLTANASLKFAKYHSNREEWQQTLRLLEFNFKELSDSDTSSAFMFQGLSLQNLKRHRDAIKIYRKVTKKSDFYTVAQINIAVALIRQDWWTDAHIVLNQLLSTEDTQQDEITNRLYLMLGHSLLNQEYFRESRDAFRNISLDSQYTNKALMGLILAAISQGDNSGALNILSVLNKKKSNDLVIEETYLLLPNIYQKLGQYASAITAYNNAIAYYKKRIEQLNNRMKTNIQDRINDEGVNRNIDLTLRDTHFKFTDLYPRYFVDNFNQLKQLKLSVKSPEVLQQIDNLIIDYNHVFSLVAKEHIENRLQNLISYLSQSNYGLAQLYDISNE